MVFLDDALEGSRRGPDRDQARLPCEPSRHEQLMSLIRLAFSPSQAGAATLSLPHTALTNRSVVCCPVLLLPSEVGMVGLDPFAYFGPCLEVVSTVPQSSTCSSGKSHLQGTACRLPPPPPGAFGSSPEVEAQRHSLAFTFSKASRVPKNAKPLVGNPLRWAKEFSELDGHL